MADFTDGIHKPISSEPSDVNAGDTSDEMLKKLDGYKDRLGGGHLGYMYNYWVDRGCADPRLKANRVPIFGEGPEKQQLQELKGLNWGLMWGRIQRLNNLSASSKELPAAADKLASDVHNAWKTDGGGQASDAFTKIKQAAQAAQDTTSTISASLDKLRTESRNAIDQLSKFADGPGKNMNDWYGDEDKLNVGDRCSQADRLEDTLHGNYETVDSPKTVSDGQGGQVPAEPDYTSGDIEDHSPGHVAYPYIQNKKLTADFMRKTPGIKVTMGDNFYANDAINYLNDFASNYEGITRNFRTQVDNAHTAIGNLMLTLTNSINSANLNPFGNLTTNPPPPEQPQPSKQDTGGGSNNHTPPPQTTHAPDQSGGMPTSTASADTPPPTQHAGIPAMPAVGTPTTPSGEVPTMPGGTTPTTPPTTGITDPSGTPVPGMPAVGTPTAPAQPGGSPETVTVKGPDGRDIQMSSPDGQGHMKLTIDDGSGHPKSYEVDFAQGAGQPDASGHAVTDATGQPVPAQPATGSSPTASGVLGQQGADGSQHITADPSGHAVIHDGQNTITVDKGADGAVKVSVDDGSGHPTSYTLDSSGGGAAASPLTGAAPDASALSNSAAPSGADLSGADTTGSSGGADSSGITSPAAMQGGGAGVAMAGAGGDATSGPGVATSGSSTQPPGQGGYTGSDPSMMGGQHNAGAGVAHAGGAPAAGAGGPGVAAPGGDQSGGGGGMPMMGGGMGGMGGGGGSDLERGESSWRTEGNLFDDVGTAAVDEIEELLTGNDPNRR